MAEERDLQAELDFAKAELEQAILERKAASIHVQELRKALRIVEKLVRAALSEEA